MAFNAGNAFITISPDMSKFQTDIKTKMARQGDEAARAFGGSFQARLKASFASLPKATVNADADTTAAKAKLDALTKTRTAKVRVSIDRAGLRGLALPALAAGGASALGPSALGLGAGLAGLGTAFAAAGAAATGFGVVAKGMFSDVTDAQKKLTQAQEAYNKATTDKARAKALADEKRALEGLTPAEKALAVQLTSLQDAWKRLDKAEQPVVGRALAPWLSAATSGLQLLDPLIADGAGAVQLLGTEAKRALAAPFWGTFFNTLGTTGQIGLVNFGEAAGKVADGFAHLFTTFAPDIDKLPPLVNRLAGSFDKWARSVTAGGLENFFAKTFSPSNVAMLKQDLGSLATITGNIAKAGAQLSPTAFSGLSNLLSVLARLSPGQIEALAVVYGAARTVGGAGNLARLATGGAGIGLPGRRGKAAEGAGKKTARGRAGAGLGAVAAGVLIAPQVLSSIPNNGDTGVPGQQGNFFETPFGMPGPKSPKSANNWLTSWAPYERLVTTTIPGWWSQGYEGFQRNFAGPVTNWFTSSLPRFFTSSIPANVWSPAYEGFQRNVAGPLTAWFTASLPHFFTSGVPGAWSWAYEGFQRNVGSPVASWFGSSVPHFFTSAVPGAWSWAWTGFQRNAGGPVASWFTGSMPRFFTSGVPAAWSWAWSLFGSHVGAPVAGWFTRSLPSFVTRSIPGAFSSLWSSFSANVVGPVAGFFTSTLPGLASRAQGFFGGILSKIGFASGTRSAPPGWFWVGEHGPELMRFAGGEQVLSHTASLAAAQSAASLSSLRVPSAVVPSLPGVGSPVRGGPLTLRLSYAGSGNAVVDALVEGLRADIGDKSGGDVQRHLGRP